MISRKFTIIFFILLPIVVCVTVVEDVYITQQLLEFFGDSTEDESNESVRERLLSSDEKKSAQLLSQMNTKDRADHYWTRLGHRSRTSISPNYGYDYYYGQWANTESYNSYQLGKRRRRNVKLLAENRRKRNLDDDKNKLSTSKLTMDQQNMTSEQPTSNIDNKFRRKFNKCCSNTVEATQNINENFQNIKSQCLQEVKKSRASYKSENATIESEGGGVYNLFSCDRLNSWKATITCTINCMGQKLGMVDSDGVIDVKITKSTVPQMFIHQKWQQDLSDDFVEKCFHEVSEKPSTNIEMFGLLCNTRMAEFAYCMWREFFTACPVERQNKSKQCEKLRLILRNNSNKNEYKAK